MMSGSSSSATVRVEKATSDLLINPDWTMNMDICDFVNTNPGQARDVLKAIKKRLQHKSPKVHFLALTLLETMVQNCGDYVHFQIVEKNILDDMVKIVKKKTDMNVRHKTLELLDAWQVGFGGQGGKYPQYYYAYDELRRSGVQFPQRSQHAPPPIFTPQPPIAHPMVTQVQGYGMPSNSSRRLDEAMASERESLSASTMDSMQNVTELLADMLQAMNPDDSMATKDDIVVDVVDRCRANQKKLMQMLTTTEDEELLGRGLELHDNMQTLLAKHDAIASGCPMPIQQTTSLTLQTTEKHNLGPKESEEKQEQSPKPPCVSPSTSATTAISKGFIDEEEEEDDDFAQLARRHYKPQSSAQESKIETAESSKSSLQSDSKALALTDPPVPVKTTREQDMIDLLSLALTTTTPYAEETNSQIPPTNQNLPVSPSGEDSYAAHSHPSDPRHSQPQVPLQQEYVAPWAADPHQQQSFIQQQHQQGPFSHQPQLQQPFMQPPQQQSYLQPHQQQPFRQTPRPQYPPDTYSYPPPPWATSSFQNPYVAEEEVNKQPPPPQNFNSFSSSSSSSSSMGSSNGPHVSSGAVNGGASSTGSKPYVPPYKLFEDLNVLGSRDSGSSNTSSTSLSGQSRVGGWT